jgi:hypothetical protein
MPRKQVGWAVAVLGAVACSSPLPPNDPRMIAEWMQNYYGLIRAERVSPPVASRLMAYASVALYEGLAVATPALRSLAGQLNGLDSVPGAEAGRTYDATLTAIAAERTVLDTLFREGLPATRAALATLGDSLGAARRGLGIPPDIQSASDELGRRIGLAVLAWAARDGFDSTRSRPWKPPVGAQYWINDTPADQYMSQSLSAATDFVALDNPSASLQPGSASERGLVVNRPKAKDIKTLKAVNPTGATEPWWGSLRPFALKEPNECPAPAPASYGEGPDAPIYAEARQVYDVGKALTEDQRKIALYWADNAGQSGTPVGHWLSIGSQMVDQLKLPFDRAAEMFVLMTLAQADAFIGCWHTKYEFNVLRPITYIRRHIDPEWEPFIVTPPFPEYTSGHSIQSSAAATVLTGLLGAVAFDDSTNLAIGHPVRRFESFTAASDEAAISRLYGGIHYPMAISNGQEQGRCIGRHVLERLHTRREG